MNLKLTALSCVTCLLFASPSMGSDDDGMRNIILIAGPRRWGNTGRDVLSRPEDKRDLIAAAWVLDEADPKPKHLDLIPIDLTFYSDLGMVEIFADQWFAIEGTTLSELSSLDSLELIDLSGVDISIKELSSFRGRLTNLKIALIEDVPVTIELLEELVFGRRIELISISKSGLSDSQIESFRHAHPSVSLLVDEHFVIDDSLLLRIGVSRGTNIDGRRYTTGFPSR